MLRIQLIGHLGTDVELRYTQKGAPLATARVAVDQVHSAPGGERQETAEWFTVRVAGRQSEFAQRLGKGARVFVDGRLSISHYTSRDGEPRVGFDVWADDIQSVSPRPLEAVEPSSRTTPSATEDVDTSLDDLPF
jgi:single-strand DNA-binding protein